MKLILITTEKDRASVYHKEEPDINQFSTYIRNTVEIVSYWIHTMPMRDKLMKSKDQLSLSEIRELIAEKICG